MRFLSKETKKSMINYKAYQFKPLNIIVIKYKVRKGHSLRGLFLINKLLTQNTPTD